MTAGRCQHASESRAWAWVWARIRRGLQPWVVDHGSEAAAVVDGCNDDMVAVIKFILIMYTEYRVSRQGIEIPAYRAIATRIFEKADWTLHHDRG